MSGLLLPAYQNLKRYEPSICLGSSSIVDITVDLCKRIYSDNIAIQPEEEDEEDNDDEEDNEGLQLYTAKVPWLL